MIPRESNKGYIAKTGRSVCTRVIREHDKDRYTTFRTHKTALLMKKPTRAACPVRFSDETMWIVGIYTGQARSYPNKALH